MRKLWALFLNQTSLLAGRKLTPPPVKARALELGIEVYQPPGLRKEGRLDPIFRMETRPNCRRRLWEDPAQGSSSNTQSSDA